MQLKQNIPVTAQVKQGGVHESHILSISYL